MSRFRRIAPTAPPLGYANLLAGVLGIFRGKRRVAELEREIQDFFGVRHAFLLSSGKAALVLILRALQRLYPEKDEVVIPAYTCFSVPSGIVRAGLRVSACDIDETTFGMDVERLGKSITEKTLCVIPTHLFGIPGDIETISEVCRDRKVPVVEDAAQSMGGRHRGRYLGTFGDAGFFSLGRGKNLTCGTGGIVLTDSDELSREIGREYGSLSGPRPHRVVVEMLKLAMMTAFIRPRLYWIPSMLPFLRIGETKFDSDFPVESLAGFQAGVLGGWRDRMEESNKVRTRNTEYYRERISSSAPVDRMPCNRFPVILEDEATRNRLFDAEGGRELGVSRMYPSPVNEIEEIRSMFDGVQFPSAKRVSERILTLPTHPLLTGADRENICRLFRG